MKSPIVQPLIGLRIGACHKCYITQNILKNIVGGLNIGALKVILGADIRSKTLTLETKPKIKKIISALGL